MGSRSQSIPLAFFLMGPTAAGKTQIAVEIAERFPVDVISVDSGQVYKGMDIGTAKPTQDIIERVPHKLIDICSPWQSYSAGQFRRDALIEIEKSVDNGRIPLLAGGTSFYFRALEHGLSDLPQRSEEISQSLMAEADEEGWRHLYERLMAIDPESAREISPNDSQRILRLLELYRSAGESPSQIRQSHPAEPFPYRIVKIAVVRPDREEQNRLIRQRFNKMLEEGFLEEAEGLYKSNQFDLSLPSMRCVGYQQAFRFLMGQCDYEEMVEDAVRETCGIAKRQLTWIRNQAGVIWMIYGKKAPVDNIVKIMSSVLSTDRSTTSPDLAR